MTRRALLGAFVLATSCAPWHEELLPAPVSPDRAGTGELLAGMARVDITPPPGVGLAGSGPEGRRSTGYRTRLNVGALVLQDPTGERIALVVADLPHISANLHRLAASQLARSHGIGADRLILSATHTHSGPGHFYGERQYNASSSRVPGYDPRMTELLVDRIVLAVATAAGSLRRAAIKWGTTPIPGAVTNRSVEAYCRNAKAEPAVCKPGAYEPKLAVDNTLFMLRVDALDSTTGPQPLGSYSVFAMHPTAIPSLNTLLDGDLFGRIVSRMSHERAGVHILANGAQGDVAPDIGMRKPCDLPRIGVSDRIPMPRGPGEAVDFVEPPRRMVEECLRGELAGADSLADGVAAKATWLYDTLGHSMIRHIPIRRAFLSAWLPGRDSLCVTPEAGSATAAGAEGLETRIRGWRWLFWPLFRLAIEEGGSAVDRKARGCQAPKRILLGEVQAAVIVGEHGLPHVAQLSVVRLGPLLLAAVPAELTTTAGARVRSAMRAAVPAIGGDSTETVLVGLANGFLQYVTTEEEYGEQAYEGGSNLYGPGMQRFLGRRLAELAAAVATDAPSPPAEVPPIVAYPGKPSEILPEPHPGPPPEAAAPVDLRCEGGHLTGTWLDLGPRNLFPRNEPWLAIQRHDPDSGWVDVAEDGDGELEIHALGSRGKHGFAWRAVWRRSADGARFRLARLGPTPRVSNDAQCETDDL